MLVPNGAGGDGTGGDGGAGGNGGGFFILSGELGHATVSSNHLGGAGGPGTGVGGAPGTGPLPGAAGGKATGGGYPLPNGGGALFVCCGLGSALSLSNSIVTDNDSPSCSATDLGDGGHNVVYPDTSCPGTYADPLLQPLADNGGPTQTRAIGPSSPALDAVPINGGNCADADQRGVTRPRVSGCDSGAFEYALTEATTGDAAGVSDTGATLNGQIAPNGHATSYHFEYGTTEDYGRSTASQDAGNGVSGVPVSAGVGGLAPATTYHYRVVASNAGGTVAGEDRRFTTQAGTGSSGVAPVILSASLRPKRFAVKRKKGTTFSYRLSEAATVTVTIKRRGMRAKRFRVASAAGTNKHRFSGRIGRKRLKPGRYVATLIARDVAGNASKPKRLTFTILRR